MVDSRHLPAFAGVVAFTAMLLGRSGTAAGVLFAGGLLAWSAALGSRSLAPPRYLLLVFSLALGLCVGGLATVRIQSDNRVFLGLPGDVITQTECTALEDLRPWGDDGFTARVKLRRVMGADSQASTFGRATVFSAASARFAAGAHLSVRGRVVKTHSGEVLIRAVSVTPSGYATQAHAYRALLRQELLERIDWMGYPASGLFSALMLGDRSRLPVRMVAVFDDTGTTHILALSGLHVGIVVALIGFLLSPIRCYWLRSAVTAIALIAYLALAGLRPSLTRAALVVVAASATRQFDRRLPAVSVLGIAMMMHLLIIPGDVLSLSFGLSYGAFAGIAWLGPPIAERLLTGIPEPLATSLALSLGAQILTLPLVLYAFGSYQPVSIVATLVALPLITAFVWLGILWLPFAALPLIGQAGPALLDRLSRLLLTVGGFLGRVPSVTMRWELGVVCTLVVVAGVWVARWRMMVGEVRS